jgi:predicted amidohydrolase
MGEVIAEAGEGEEGLVIADLKAQDLVQVRKDGGWAFFLRYRRPELYGSVAAREF